MFEENQDDKLAGYHLGAEFRCCVDGGHLEYPTCNRCFLCFNHGIGYVLSSFLGSAL